MRKYTFIILFLIPMLLLFLFSVLGIDYLSGETSVDQTFEVSREIDTTQFPDLSFFYFNSETFLSMNLKQLTNFAKMYSKFNWIH